MSGCERERLEKLIAGGRDSFQWTDFYDSRDYTKQKGRDFEIWIRDEMERREYYCKGTFGLKTSRVFCFSTTRDCDACRVNCKLNQLFRLLVGTKYEHVTYTVCSPCWDALSDFDVKRSARSLEVVPREAYEAYKEKQMLPVKEPEE